MVICKYVPPPDNPHPSGCTWMCALVMFCRNRMFSPFLPMINPARLCGTNMVREFEFEFAESRYGKEASSDASCDPSDASCDRKEASTGPTNPDPGLKSSPMSSSANPMGGTTKPCPPVSPGCDAFAYPGFGTRKGVNFVSLTVNGNRQGLVMYVVNSNYGRVIGKRRRYLDLGKPLGRTPERSRDAAKRRRDWWGLVLEIKRRTRAGVFGAAVSARRRRLLVDCLPIRALFVVETETLTGAVSKSRPVPAGLNRGRRAKRARLHQPLDHLRARPGSVSAP